jgi:hypothetical protein
MDIGNSGPPPSESIAKERVAMGRLLGALTVAAVSGFITYWFIGHSSWQQFTYLLHTGVGLYLTLILIPYVRTHFVRTLGTRRPFMIIGGLTSTAFVIGLIVTGLHITIAGQSEAKRLIYDAHIVSAYVVLGGIGLHILGQRLIRKDRRRNADLGWFPTITSKALIRVPVALGSAIIVIALCSAAYSLISTKYSTEAVIQPYEHTYGDHPFRPSQTETASGSFVDVRQISGSEQCGSCHQDITQQWTASIHSQAASDQAYQTNVNLLSTKKGMAATRYCEGCHAPVALLTGQLTTGGRLDTNGHLHEGVNCLTCHGMSEAVHLKGVASFKFEPAADYLFANRTGSVPTKIHNFLLKIQPRQHRVSMGRELLHTPKMCATCHAQFMDKDMNNWGWVKMQDDFTAWLNSPYSGQGAQTFSRRIVTRCQDCHMPLISADDPSADNNGMVHAHFMPGANTAIPWGTNNREQLQRVTDFLQADVVRISFERPSRIESVESNSPIATSTSIKEEAPPYFYLGETAKLTAIVTNVGVGHDFPGGTTDINEAWIHVRVSDAEQNLVFESGAISDGNDVDPKAQFYRTLAVDRSGKHVWRHDLFNMVGDSYKKAIPAGESDLVEYAIPVPAWAKSPLSVSATVRYRKLNNQYGRWALKQPEAILPIVDVARTAISIPVREKPKVVSDSVAGANKSSYSR